MALAYQRLLIKISGEALMGEEAFGLDMHAMNQLGCAIAEVHQLGAQIALVFGAGNFFRGNQISHEQVNRVTADQMGMLATVMNGLAMRDLLRSLNIPTDVVTATTLEGFCPRYNPQDTVLALEAGKVMILAGGTGNPFFTTDSAGALRGIEIGADLLIKATKVDGIYTADPFKNPEAQRYETLTFDEAVRQKIQVMDTTAFVLCAENKLDIRVFNVFEKGALKRLVQGQVVGTLVTHQ